MIIDNVRVDRISQTDALKQALIWAVGNEQRLIVSINPEGVVLAQKNEFYREILNHAALALADGVGIIFAGMVLQKKSKVQGPRSKINISRFTGIDFMCALCDEAAKNGWRVYLVGGVGETARMAAERLRTLFPGLIIEGEEGIPRSGNFQFPISNFQTHNDSKLINRINEFQPHFLFVALGQPKQEIWIAQNLSKMPSVRAAMGVGGAFDFISGRISRAPLIMRIIGLEWLWRLILQPQRLPRIFNATVGFAWLVVKERFKR